LKKGLHVDYFDANLNEVLKLNNLDVSDEIICVIINFPLLFSHTLNDFTFMII